MIFIDRDYKTPDANWETKAKKLTKELLAAISSDERNRIIDDNEAVWTELKSFLLEISNQKCWYSESKDKFSHLHVDHFRPKKVAIGIDKKDHGGYWWLTFEWTNYRVSGSVGNVRKRDKFAVKYHKAVDSNSDLDDEIYYFLDPTVLEDTLKLTFNSNGEAMPIENTGWDNERVSYTIDNLNLNFKALKEARKVLWMKCSTLVSEIQGLMNENNKNPSPTRRAKISEKLKNLKEFAKTDSEFSATAKACLRSTGLPWALSVAV